MTLQHAALPLHHLGCAAGGPIAIERILRHVPGVTRVYVNPVTEMAYVEYDRERCDERVLAGAIAHAGYGDASRHHAGGPVAAVPARAPRERLAGGLAALMRRALHIRRRAT